jgi:predicted ATPase/DNA-binding NarL/FixJ family response regulator
MASRNLKPEPVLVGRGGQLDDLWSQFAESTTGHMRVAFVAGEPGIGKTRLLREVAQRAEHLGATVLWGGASEAEGMPPYLPFLEALGQHIRMTPPDELREQTGTMTSVLTTILPELVGCLGNLPSSYPLPPEQARLRLYEAVSLFFAAIAAPHGLLLLLDDLQWADAATLDLLCHLPRSQPNARLLLLGAYREGQVTHRSAFERVLTELNRFRILRSISLGPLPETDLSTLAANALGTPVDEALSRRLAAQSEGNPFFAEELLWGWLETGIILQQEGKVRFSGTVAAQFPPGMVNAVRQRIGRLAPQVISLLQIASLIGRTFDMALLAEVAVQDGETVEEQLQEAERALLIRSEQPGTFSFSHDMIRACLSEEVRSYRRTRMHLLIGQRLSLRLDHADAPHLAEVAFHFARSGDREQGAMYAYLAAQQAGHAYAAEAAVGHYHTALSLVDDFDPRRGEWLQGLGETALLAAAPQVAIGAFQSAQDWWTRSQNRMAAGRAALGLGRAHWRREEIGLARTALQQAVALLSANPGAEPVQALIELGSLLALSLHELTEARGVLEQALTLAHQFNDVRLEAAASRALGSLLLRSGDVQDALRLLEQALVKADEVDDVWEANETCASLSLAYRWAGAFDRQQEVLQRWLVYARRCHDPYQVRHLYSFLAAGYALRGQQAKAEEALAEGQRIVDRLDSPEPQTMLQFTRGSLVGLWGDLDTSEELLRAAIVRFRDLEPRSLVWWLGGLGFVLAVAGKRQKALDTLEELAALIAPLPDEAMTTAHALCDMAAIVAWLEDREWAASLYPSLLPFRVQMHAFSMDRLLGALATLLGDFPAARVHLAAAEEATRRSSFQVELATTLLNQADLELAEHRRSGLAAARALLEEAADLSAQGGFQGLTLHLRQRLQQLSGKGTRPHLPAGLSQREVEVLRLVAQGKSNRTIAEALVISERTVINHLASVFNKTGVTNRAGATAFAIRHGLAEEF